MRWSYKTVHYDYKKEGLLGGVFLDEAEVEESMNEFGRAGWELVSLLEVQEGLMATFKQQIKEGTTSAGQRVVASETKEDQPPPTVTPRFLRPERPPQESVPPRRQIRVESDEETEEKSRPDTATPPIQPLRSMPEKTIKKRQIHDDEENGSGAGAIRIE